MLKGLCGVVPGVKYQPSEIAQKMITDIETQETRYANSVP